MVPDTEIIVQDSKRSLVKASFITVLSLLLFVLAGLVHRKLRSRRPVPKEITVHAAPWTIHANHYGGYRDELYNGRHVSNVNLRANSEFADSGLIDVKLT